MWDWCLLEVYHSFHQHSFPCHHSPHASFPSSSFPPPFTQVQARRHQTKFWINCLIIPCNITVTPNLANTHQHTPIHPSAAYPLWYLWDAADKWQRCLSANPEPFAQLGVCCWEEKKKSLRDNGRCRGVLASFLLSDWLKWTSCRVMDFFWQERWFGSTMLLSRLWKIAYFLSEQVFMLVKSVDHL